MDSVAEYLSIGFLVFLGIHFILGIHQCYADFRLQHSCKNMPDITMAVHLLVLGSSALPMTGIALALANHPLAGILIEGSAVLINLLYWGFAGYFVHGMLKLAQVVVGSPNGSKVLKALLVFAALMHMMFYVATLYHLAELVVDDALRYQTSYWWVLCNVGVSAFDIAVLTVAYLRVRGELTKSNYRSASQSGQESGDGDSAHLGLSSKYQVLETRFIITVVIFTLALMFFTWSVFSAIQGYTTSYNEYAHAKDFLSSGTGYVANTMLLVGFWRPLPRKDENTQRRFEVDARETSSRYTAMTDGVLNHDMRYMYNDMNSDRSSTTFNI